MKHLILVSLVVVFACGGSDKDNSPPECTANGVACASDDECCVGNCDELTGLCARVVGACLPADAECFSGPDCCSFSCVNYRCSADQCTSDDQACDEDGECCSGVCTDGVCAPLNPSCRTSGNACDANEECCSGLCKDDVCNAAPSYCTQVDDACTLDSECCSGLCSIADGAALGVCIVVPASGATGCASAGEVCGAGANYNGEPLDICGGECCSRACFPYGPSGVLICQPPSGCRPTGETCTQDSDCCGGEGTVDGDQQHVTCEKVGANPVGRCSNGQSCRAAGQVCKLDGTSCNAETNCCAGNSETMDTCHQDALGVPRCGEVDLDCTDPSTKVGMACGSSADCCGLPCTPDATGAYVCAGTCVAEGGTCTTTADCCAGLPCNVPAGSSQGTCGSPQGCIGYGQQCEPGGAMACCDNVTCMDADGDGAYQCDAMIIF
ncbi:MAG: hypothetical protein AB7P03_22375 [Kofleriaceae bacterium]